MRAYQEERLKAKSVTIRILSPQDRIPLLLRLSSDNRHIPVYTVPLVAAKSIEKSIIVLKISLSIFRLN